jgi:DNA-binding transcriptional LysR family regulator
MEMHQVRYFLAVARTLNFTRAAEECNVTQPSLTRAIKQLEDEFGGDLFRRERPHAILTELGERMHPLLTQCYDSAVGARALASSLKKGEVGSLKLALSHTVDLSLLTAHLTRLTEAFPSLEVKLLRGTAPEILEILKRGDAELGLGSTIGEIWERLDRWTLFEEPFQLLVHRDHRLANRETVDLQDLHGERLLRRSYCEHVEQLALLLCKDASDVAFGCDVASESDLNALLAARMGIAVAPSSVSTPECLIHVPINGLELRRTVYLYGVAGRQRSAVTSAMMKLLRGANWTPYAN